MWPQMLIPIIENTLQHSLNHLYEVFSNSNVIQMTWRVLLKTQVLMQTLAEIEVSSSPPGDAAAPWTTCAGASAIY